MRPATNLPATRFPVATPGGPLTGSGKMVVCVWPEGCSFPRVEMAPGQSVEYPAVGDPAVAGPAHGYGAAAAEIDVPSS